MAVGLVGKKLGMTRVFKKDGEAVPVTVVEVQPNRITQIKTIAQDGYDAIQVTTGMRRSSRVNKPMTGHFAKAGVEAGCGLWEFRLVGDEVGVSTEVGEEANGSKFKVGAELTVNFFTEGQKVDVTGTSKGKGFAGTVKRHNFSTQDATHGNSLSHRAPGSIGQNQTPGRVFKGKKMAGHMGNVRRTIQLLTIVHVDPARHLLLISGAVPGASNSNVIVRPSIKMKNKEEVARQ